MKKKSVKSAGKNDDDDDDDDDDDLDDDDDDDDDEFDDDFAEFDMPASKSKSKNPERVVMKKRKILKLMKI
ncbi:MAG: hypothetical protein HWD58_07360 [Bacteroidota bacterium]|nr:MAG: hypothetical protein HWD58_07360 [Bacteroidota bacterium]